MQKSNKMGIMPIPQLVFGMSLPIMVSMLVQSLYNIVDGIFVAQISEKALTATSIAYSAQMLQIAVAVGTGVGVNAVTSRYLGAKNFEKVNRTATTGLVLTVLSSLVFVIWGIFGTHAFIGLFTKDPEILDLGTTYLRICQIFSTGIFLGTLFQRLLQSTGRTFLSMLAQLAGAVVNIVLDPILIFGLFGAPALGIKGAAIATVLGQWSAALLGLVLHIIQNKEIHFEFHGFQMEKEIIKLIYKVGAPTILMQAIGSIMVAFMNLVLGIFTETAVTFFGVYYKLQSFLFMPMNGLGQGTLPVIAFNYGAGNPGRVKEAAKLTLVSGACIGLAGTIIFFLAPGSLLRLFSATEHMKAIGIPGLRIISLTFPFASMSMIIGYIISGLGNGTVNMTSTAIRQLVPLIPLVWVIGSFLGIDFVWYSFWVSELAAFGFAWVSLKHFLRRVSDANASGSPSPHSTR